MRAKLACTESQHDKAHPFAEGWTERRRFVIAHDGVPVEVEVVMRVDKKLFLPQEALRAVSDEVASWLEGL